MGLSFGLLHVIDLKELRLGNQTAWCLAHRVRLRKHSKSPCSMGIIMTLRVVQSMHPASLKTPGTARMRRCMRRLFNISAQGLR